MCSSDFITQEVYFLRLLRGLNNVRGESIVIKEFHSKEGDGEGTEKVY